MRCILLQFAALAGPAAAQCGQWLPGNQLLDINITAVTQWDPDGPGPLPPTVLLGGPFQFASGSDYSFCSVVQWDGRTLARVSTSCSPTSSVDAIATFDVQGTGRPLVIVGGSGSPAYWDGAAWRRMGTSITGSVNSLFVADFDGPGSDPPRLFAGGLFRSFQATSNDNIVMWNGTDWTPLGSGCNGRVRAMALWDPDGPGGQTSLLVAAGDFSTAGGVAVSGIATWNPLTSSWQPLGSSIPITAIRGLAVYDFDGPTGPELPQPVIGLSDGVYRWNNAAWTAVAEHVAGANLVTAHLSPDPSAPDDLVAFGSFILNNDLGEPLREVARLDGAHWRPMGGLTGGVTAACAAQLPGSDPILVAAGTFTDEYRPVAGQGSLVSVRSPAYWNGRAWQRVGDGLDRPSYGAASFDSDGPLGPNPPQIVVATSTVIDRTAGIQTSDRWEQLGVLRGSAITPRVLDLDGAGPGFPELFMFGSLSGATVNRWVPPAWVPMNGLNGVPKAMEVFDPDGDAGPLPPVLYAGTNVGPSPVMYWDGTLWRSTAVLSGLVSSMAVGDLDGPGPLGPELIVGGSNIFLSGSQPTASVIAFNGVSWRTLMSSAMSSSCMSVVFADPDGADAEPPRLVVAHFPGPNLVTRVAYYDGSFWRALGVAGTSGEVTYLASIDPDGPGPVFPQLIAAGQFASIGNVQAYHLARWNGHTWGPMVSGTDAPLTITGICVHAADPASPTLVVTGSMARVGGVLASNIAQWRPSGYPAITGDPVDAQCLRAGDCGFEVTASGSPLSYHWRKDLVPLSDGSTPFGSTISGAFSNHLTISNIADGDTGSYDCIVSNPCGELISAPAMLSLRCIPDFNGDGGIDGADVEAFFLSWQSGDAFADVNADGGVDGGDVEAFFRLWETGAC